jgi:hypothetical protein
MLAVLLDEAASPPTVHRSATSDAISCRHRSWPALTAPRLTIAAAAQN